VKRLATVHRQAEAHVCQKLNFEEDSSDETSDETLPSVNNADHVCFHLDSEACQEATLSGKHSKSDRFHLYNHVSSSPAWIHFDIDDLPEDGLKAFPLGCSSALKWKGLDSVFPPVIQGDSPTPSRVRAVKSNDLQNLTNQLFPQDHQIQHDMVSVQHEVEEDGIEWRQMSDILAKSQRSMENLEKEIEPANHCQHAQTAGTMQMLPIGKRYVSVFGA
jgi:hypothetical protein